MVKEPDVGASIESGLGTMSLSDVVASVDSDLVKDSPSGDVAIIPVDTVSDHGGAVVVEQDDSMGGSNITSDGSANINPASGLVVVSGSNEPSLDSSSMSIVASAPVVPVSLSDNCKLAYTSVT